LKKDNRLEYLPWSDKIRESCGKVFIKGGIPILEIETSSKCLFKKNYGGCSYCDSETGQEQDDELNIDQIKRIIYALKDKGLQWLFICGIGEPLDDNKFLDIIRYCNKLGIKSSVFTNGLYLSKKIQDLKKLVKELYKNHVSLLIKYDSPNAETFADTLGISDTSVIKRNYDFLDKALEIGYCSDSEPDLALSIVPTKKNIKQIPEIINYCLSKKIYPLIGELEKAGSALDSYEKIVPSYEELKLLKKYIEKILGYQYKIPICPASIYSLHINNKGLVTVDEFTGLSCYWFHLKNPKIKTIGNILNEDPVTILNKILRYRESKLNHLYSLELILKKSVFGGCGGKEILEEYKNYTKIVGNPMKSSYTSMEKKI